MQTDNELEAITGDTNSLATAINAIRDLSLVGQPLDGTIAQLDAAPKFIALPGDHKVIDLTAMAKAYLSRPLRATGKCEFGDVTSLIDYVNAMKTSSTRVFWHTPASFIQAAKQNSPLLSIVAVLNDHSSATEPGWQDFSAALSVLASDELREWLAGSGRQMPSVEFAEFLEEHAADIVDPSPDVMLKVATSIQGKRTIQWQSGHRLDNGMVEMQYVEGGQDKAAGGSITIPQLFTVGCRLVKSSPLAVRMNARFKYRMTPQGVAMWYELARPADAIEAGIDLLMTPIESLKLPTHRGG